MVARVYWRLILSQLRLALMLAMQYRVEFIANMFVGLFWLGITLVPVVVLFDNRRTVAGWSWPDALLVLGFYNMLRGTLNVWVTPSLSRALARIQDGSLDFVLLRPIDAQFSVSTLAFLPLGVFDLAAGMAIVGYGLHLRNAAPSWSAVTSALLVFSLGVVIVYSISLMFVAAAFTAVRAGSLFQLFNSVLDLARWPAALFRGVLALVFTFVVPLIIMTTYPALALLGGLGREQWLQAIALTVAFVVISRITWVMALRRYTSAGG